MKRKDPISTFLLDQVQSKIVFRVLKSFKISDDQSFAFANIKDLDWSDKTIILKKTDGPGDHFDIKMVMC